MAERIQTYAEFWPFYLNEHSRPATRSLHYFGTCLGILLLVLAIVLGDLWLVLAAVIVGYSFAWFAHFFVEHNRPATFTYPLWSFVSDFKMLWCWLAGRLGRELTQAGID